MKQVDYSEQAITLRLKRLSQLRRVCVSLKQAGAANRQPPAVNR